MPIFYNKNLSPCMATINESGPKDFWSALWKQGELIGCGTAVNSPLTVCRVTAVKLDSCRCKGSKGSLLSPCIAPMLKMLVIIREKLAAKGQDTPYNRDFTYQGNLRFNETN